MFKKIIRITFFCLFGLILTLLIAEILLRIYYYLGEKQLFGIKPARTTLEWIDHPKIGKVLLKPNSSGWFVTPSKEYYSFIKVNSQGFYDFEHSFEKPPDVIRVIFLGDSFVASIQTPLDRTFFKQVEKTLSSIYKNKKIEVIALGMGDTGSAQQLIALEEIGLKYSPDIVIQMFLTANDVKNNSPTLQKDPSRPYFVATPSGELKLLPHKKYSERNNSEIKEKIKDLIIVELFLQARQRFLEYKTNNSLDYPIDYHVYDVNPDKNYLEAWDITKKLILKTKEITEISNSKYVLVTLANNEQVNQSLWSELKRIYRNLAKANLDLEKPDKMILQFCLENNITCLQLLPEFQKFAINNPNTPTHYQLDGHWNQVGTDLVARYLFNQFQTILP